MRRIKNRSGEVHYHNKYGNVKIISNSSSHDVNIKFSDGTIVQGLNYADIIKGQIKNPNFPEICGIGFIGQGKYNYKNYKIAYNRWRAMIKRGYCEIKDIKQLSYLNCTISSEWHNFQNYAKWFEENYIEGWELDKDLLFKNNKHYSSKNCCFIPKELNIAFTDSKKARGNYPLGVSKNKGKFSSRVGVGKSRKFLGYFDTKQEAFKTYKKAKEEYLKSLAIKYKDQLDSKVYKAIINYKIEITD